MNSVSCEITQQGPSTLNVTFSIRGEINLPSLQFSSLIVTLTTVFNELACTVLRHLLEGIDTLLLVNREAGVEYCNRKPRTLKTIFGEVSFRCRQAKKHGIHFSPLIEALGIPRKKRITQDLLALSLIAALYASYRNAVKTGGMPCALSTLWNAVQKEGRAYIHTRDAALAYYQQGEPLIPASPRDFAMVMMDEIHIRHTKKKKHLKVKVARHREAIYGLKAYQNDIPAEYLRFGTGPIERLQAVMVAYRMKKRGMHWSVDGAENLIQLLAKERNGEDVDQVIEEGLRGLKEWEELCDRASLDESPPHYFTKKKGNQSDFSPYPMLCIPLLQGGKQGPTFTALKEISARKLIPPIPEKRKGVIQRIP